MTTFIEDYGARSEFIAFFFAPAGSGDVGLPIAASRAGAVGVVNGELGAALVDIRRQLDVISHPRRGAKKPFGLKLAELDHEWLALVAAYVSKGLRWLIVEERGLRNVFDRGVALPEGVRLVAEVVDRALPSCLDQVDALMVKGNESGGFVGEESSFILLQHWLKRSPVPIFVRGGLSPQTAAACAASGAAGGVFDSQLLLLEGSPLSSAARALVEGFSGVESVALGDPSGGRYFRLLQSPRCRAAKSLAAEALLAPEADLRAAVAAAKCGWGDPATELMPLGHDGAFAAAFRDRFGTVQRLFAAVRTAVADSPKVAAEAAAFTKGAPLARALGTAFPIIQGPMTRVSDNPAFAEAIAREGGLPMMAVATMGPEQVGRMLEETRRRIGDRPWGAGFLGFLPKSTLDAQIVAALEHCPHFAIIAGGRPDQAIALEERGVPCFLHLPSPKLLDYYIENGARRFVFEGRECGGHVGPMSSFVLWSLMVDRLVEEIDHGHATASELQCVFAGGVHDDLSAAFVQALAAPLLTRGVVIGILIGTAYIFTREIVETGAVVPAFQRVVVEGADTGVLTTGPGHASRCMRTPFVDLFLERQKALRECPETPEEVKRETLDSLILGTLRIASKGLRRRGDGGIETVPEGEQLETGMYMIGQVASLRDAPLTIAELHAALTAGGQARLERAAASPARAPAPASGPLEIAIIGAAAVLPGALDKDTFWANVLTGIDSVGEIPRHRWDWRLYFDEDRRARDKIYSKWGGFIEDMPFEPGEYGITPASLKSVDPMQLMALRLADQALEDAGYAKMEPVLRERTAVIIGASGGSGDVGLQYNLRSELPRFTGDLPQGLGADLPQWSEDTFAGILINVLSGRVSNRLDLGGPNFTTDAACASSLAALYQAANELRAGRSDMAIAGGVDTQQSPFGFMCFAQTQALSPRGRCRSFDQGADGIAISEGIVMLVLKRLEDAEAAGDRIYAVLKGVGSGSDGKAKALSAPEPTGQLRAMRRAYEQAGYAPSEVRLFEAHGTGTVAGDTAELESTGRLVREAGAGPRSAAIGSVKTNIGHTKATAGLAGLLKVALALHHRTLPPHLGVETPNAALLALDAPLHLVSAPEPWLSAAGQPRRAAVSAFGFGGTNFHATLEEYSDDPRPERRHATTRIWPAELLALAAADRAGLAAAADAVRSTLAANSTLTPRDIAAAYAAEFDPAAPTRGALVFSNLAELDARLALIAEAARSGDVSRLPEDVSFGEGAPTGKIAALFPGQGSQYIFMGREAGVYLHEIAETLDAADCLLAPAFGARYGAGASLGTFIFPRGAYNDAARLVAEAALTATDVAQPALGAVEAGYWRFFSEGLGLRADMTGGHSYGEFVALHAAGALSFGDLMRVSEARGRLIIEKAAAATSELGGMLAVSAPREVVEAVAAEAGLVLANHNAPTQAVLSGAAEAVARAVALCEARSLTATPLPVAAAFHSILMAPARDALAEVLAQIDWRPVSAPVYSNEHARPHSADPSAAMVDHLVRPVEFVRQIEAMHADGARVFLELGPKTVLSRLVARTLGNRPHLTLATDAAGGGLRGILQAVGGLCVDGRAVDLQRLFEDRDCAAVASSELVSHSRRLTPSRRGWWINGSGVRRADEPALTVGVTLEEVSVRAAGAEAAPVPAAANSAGALQSAGATVHTERRTNMFDRTIDTDLDGGGSSVAASYFHLVERALEGAQAVALAELGLASGGSAERQVFSGHRGGHKSIRLRPAPRLAGSASALYAAEGPAAAERAPESAAVAAAPELASAAPVAARPAAAPAIPAALGEIGLRALLLDIVAEKTGYDEDMLSFDQNLESDLGIDSIKRVDIVAGLIKRLSQEAATRLDNAKRSELSGSKTLAEMLRVLIGLEEAPANFDWAGAGEASAVPAKAVDDVPPRPSELRFIISPEAEEHPWGVEESLCEGRFLLTPCAGGLTEAVAHRLRAAGREVELLPADVLTDESALAAWIAARGEDGARLGGIVHLAAADADPLAPEAFDLALARRELFRSEKALFLLAKSLHLAPEAHVIAATALGGLFGRDGREAGLVLQGGAVGLLKSLSREVESLRCRAVDLDPVQPVEARAEALLREISVRGGRIEIGYPGGRRTVFRSRLAPIPTPAAEAAPLKGPGVILVTGGARGITAETVMDLAMPGVTLVLTGRSAEPSGPDLLRDDSVLAGLETPVAIAKHLMKAGGIAISEARQKAAKIVALREMADVLAVFRASGARVRYLPMDVRDEASIEAALDQVRAWGPVRGVIHGAGVIEDAFMGDIPSDSWDRVVETKVLGMLLLLKRIPLDTLDFFVAFASVAGRYGNAGQTSYAQANELMSRLCAQLRARTGGRVRALAINWGPWGQTRFGTGMVTAETERKFAAQGVRLVHAELGRTLFRQELFGDGSDVEVVYGSAPWEDAEAQRSGYRLTGPGGLLGPAVVEPALAGQQRLSTRVGVGEPFLADHVIDGRPVLPMAIALEIMAESVRRAFGGWEVFAVENARLYKGVVMEAPERDLVAIMAQASHGMTEIQQVAAKLFTISDERAPHYGATYLLRQRGKAAAPIRPLAVPAGARRMEGAVAYRDHLFHGPAFQAIERVNALWEEGAVCCIRGSEPADLLRHPGEEAWIFDPLVVDAIAQLPLLWASALHGRFALPVGFGRIERLAPSAKAAARIDFRIVDMTLETVVTEAVAFDAEGRPLLRVDEMTHALRAAGAAARRAEAETGEATLA